MPPPRPSGRALPSWTVPREEAGIRLDRFLAAAARLGSRARALAALHRGKVFVNGIEASAPEAGAALHAGDAVAVWMDRPGSARRRPPAAPGEPEVLYEDAALVVVNKPAGLLAVPLRQRTDAVSAQDYVQRHLRARGIRPLVVHRIDRDTSGIVLFAKHARAQEALKGQFERREPERVYLAVLHGHPDPATGVWRDLLSWDAKALVQKRAHPRDPRAKEAVSRYRVVEAFRDASLVEIRLETGKRNQIRLQAALRGHPLVGERLYQPRPAAATIPFERQALHAWRLSCRHPSSGRAMAWEAPLPADLRALLERLRPV